MLILYKVLTEQGVILSVSVVISIFICTAYSVWLFNRVCYGAPNYKYLIYTRDIDYLEMCIIGPILFFSLLIGCYPTILIQM